MISISDIHRVNNGDSNGYQLGNLLACKLTPRQSQLLLLKAREVQTSEAAEIMNCSTHTIGTHQRTLHHKMGSHTPNGMITRAFENGFLRLLSLFLATFLGTSAPTPAQAHTTQNDEQNTLRLRNRTRNTRSRRQNQRQRQNRNNNRLRRENTLTDQWEGRKTLHWDCDTNTFTTGQTA